MGAAEAAESNYEVRIFQMHVEVNALPSPAWLRHLPRRHHRLLLLYTEDKIEYPNGNRKNYYNPDNFRDLLLQIVRSSDCLSLSLMIPDPRTSAAPVPPPNAIATLPQQSSIPNAMTESTTDP